MTPETAKALLPIITAYAEGKLIQTIDARGDWVDLRFSPSFDGPPSHYRIKPEPKKPTLRWYTWEELCALHVRGNFLVRQSQGIPVLASIERVDNKVVILISRGNGTLSYLWKEDLNTGWEISFDNVNWCPLGVVEQ